MPMAKRRWRKSSPELIAQFHAATEGNRALQPRRMFGYPAVFASGKLCAGLHEENLILRLSEPDRAKLLREGAGTAWSPMPGRVMREYMALSPAVVADAAQLGRWIARAIAFTQSKGDAPKRGAKTKARAAPKRVATRRKAS